MTKTIQLVRQGLWFSVGAVPIAAGVYAVHGQGTLDMVFLSYGLISLAVPFLFFGFQKSGYGSEWGAQRSAVHLIWWAVWMLLAMGAVPYIVNGEGALWMTAGRFLMTVAAVCLMVFHMLSMIAADYMTLWCYDWIKRSKSAFTRYWLALSFFIGLVPMAVVLFLFEAGYGYFRMLYDASPIYAAAAAADIFPRILFVKLFLAMISIPLYLYPAEEGSKWKKSLTVIFMGLFWMMATYVPFAVSLWAPWDGNWRLYADPSYLSVVPILSDLWAVGLSLWVARKLSSWILSVK